MKTKGNCLSKAQLEALIECQGTQAEDATLQFHLNHCPECCRRLAEMVGDPTWWREAESMLSSAQDELVLDTLDRIQSNGPEISVSANLMSHLLQWMGPTDDPTKMGRVGGFEIVGIIGVGGAGVVLKAYDPRLNRFVAIKTLLPGLADNVVARKRFERESQSVAAISHQHVVPIYAVDSHNGSPYIAMQYVAGYSLQQRIDLTGPLKAIEVVRVAAQIAQGLAAAHAQGVIHRDIKPSNILLERTVDRVLVSDFGLARSMDDEATHTGSIAGTPQFMSPEQCHGQVIDQRSDLFSLGSVMYTMCTGKPPFRSETIMGMLKSVCDSEVPSIRERNPEIPEWLEAFIERLHKKKPQERMGSATEVAHLLEAELAHLQNPVSFPEPDRSWMPLRPKPLDAFPNRGLVMLFSFMTLLGPAAILAWRFGLPSAFYSEKAGWHSSVSSPQTSTEMVRSF
jgi:eukaryotic-like serine/threonine-protein kinase